MQFRKNNEIKAREVRVLGPDKKHHGVLLLGEALKMARSLGMDLVEVAPNTVPPVVRIVRYDEFVKELAERHETLTPPDYTKN
jgi:translation initiation factor IF-3